MSEPCDCIEEVDREPSMLASNTVVHVPIIGPRRTFVETYTAKKVRGRKPPLIMASFCPFCGVKYPEAPPSVKRAGESFDRVAGEEVAHG